MGAPNEGYSRSRQGQFFLADRSGAAPPVEHFPRPVLNGQRLPFSDAVRVGDIVYLSGQIGIGADGKLADGIEAQTKQAMDNVGAVLKRAGLRYDRIFHCAAFLADMKDWPAFNKVYVAYFPDGQMPARRVPRERPRARRQA